VYGRVGEILDKPSMVDEATGQLRELLILTEPRDRRAACLLRNSATSKFSISVSRNHGPKLWTYIAEIESFGMP
jgi:hypothetical protein